MFQKKSFWKNNKNNHDSYDKIKDEKLYDINNKATKIFAFSSGKIDIYTIYIYIYIDIYKDEYFTGE